MQSAEKLKSHEDPGTVTEQSALAFARETILTLGADHSLSEILQSWVLAVVKHLDANFARVWTVSSAGLQLQATAESGTFAGDAYAHMPVGAFVEEIAAECRPYATNDLLNDPHLMDPEWAKREGLTAFAGHPLMSRGKLVGVAAMVSRRPVSDLAMEALATSASGLALAIRRKRVEAAAKEMARDLKAKNAELTAAGRRSHALIDLSPNGILMVDRAGALTLVNSMAEKMFGFGREELLGQPADMLLPPLLRGTGAFTGREARALQARQGLSGLRKDGSEFPVEISLNPIQTEGELSVLYSIVDITERKRAEHRMLEAARLKSEFLANMSHEIRTPINVLVGMSGLLIETDLTPDQRDLADTIRNGAESLLVVINDNLDFSKMEAGKLEIDPADFEVDGVVGDVTSLFYRQAHRKGLALSRFVESDVPQYLYGDGGRLRQVLTNLVGNAVKFTESRRNPSARCGR